MGTSRATFWLASSLVCLASSIETSFTEWVLAARQQESNVESIEAWWRTATADRGPVPSPVLPVDFQAGPNAGSQSLFGRTQRFRKPVLKDHRKYVRPKKKTLHEYGCTTYGKAKKSVALNGSQRGTHQGGCGHHGKGKKKGEKEKGNPSTYTTGIPPYYHGKGKGPSYYHGEGKGRAYFYGEGEGRAYDYGKGKGQVPEIYFMDEDINPTSEKSGRISRNTNPTTAPTIYPSVQIVIASPAPSNVPSTSQYPTRQPSLTPTLGPTENPTNGPSLVPSRTLSQFPTQQPSQKPSLMASPTPSSSPSLTPTKSPSYFPTLTPSKAPSYFPTPKPSQTPSLEPSPGLSEQPSLQPSNSPSLRPTRVASQAPTMLPTASPSDSMEPTIAPYAMPSSNPITVPSASPTMNPSSSTYPTATFAPTALPSFQGDFERVTATPFNLEYLTTTNLPPTVDATGAIDFTKGYLKAFMANQLSFNQDAVLIDVIISTPPVGEVADANKYVTPMEVVLQFERGGTLPKQGDVDILLFTAFSPPFVQQLLGGLGTLGDGLFSTTEKVIYTPLP